MSSHVIFIGFDFEVDFAPFCFDEVTDFFDFTLLEGFVVGCTSSLGSKRSLRSVGVALVQVDAEHKAMRIDSAVAWREAIMITKHCMWFVQYYQRVHIVQNARRQCKDVDLNLDGWHGNDGE